MERRAGSGVIAVGVVLAAVGATVGAAAFVWFLAGRVPQTAHRQALTGDALEGGGPGTILCNDGTFSPTCRSCQQGCCSDHGGCVPGLDRPPPEPPAGLPGQRWRQGPYNGTAAVSARYQIAELQGEGGRLVLDCEVGHELRLYVSLDAALQLERIGELGPPHVDVLTPTKTHYERYLSRARDDLWRMEFDDRVLTTFRTAPSLTLLRGQPWAAFQMPPDSSVVIDKLVADGGCRLPETLP